MVSAILGSAPFAEGGVAQARQDLGINGCSVRDTATYRSGDELLTLVACAGPLGIFSSSDFGSTWSFTGGGDYSSGEAFGVAATQFGVYALRSSSTLLRSDLGSPASFTPNWEAVELDLGATEQFVTVVGLESVGSLLVFGSTSAGTAAIRVINTESGQPLPVTPLPATGQLRHFAVIGDYIFAIRRDQGDLDGPNSLYRATFNTTTGSIGSWSDITAKVTDLLSGEFSTGFVDAVYGGSGGAVYVRVSRIDAQKQVYRSGDSGENFSFSFPNGTFDGNVQGQRYYAPGEFTRACSLGSTTIINSFISNDNGVTWERFKPFISEGFNLLDEDLCLFDPRDTSGNTALVRVVEGFSKTTDMLATTPTWNPSNSGLRGIIVKGMSRVTEVAQDTVAAVTNVGLAITKNFSANDRGWLFPTCTGRKTCWNDSIALARGNSNIVFAGTEDIERGYITTDDDGTLSVDWDVILDNPSGATDGEDLPVTLNFRDFSEIPGRVFGLFQWVDQSTNQGSGGIYSFTYSTDPSDTGVTAKPVILQGKPVVDLIALNSSVLYAAIGTNPGHPGTKPVYRLRIEQDGSVSEEVDASGELGSSPGIRVFAYDSENDILYAAADNGSFYLLEQAAVGSSTWARGADVGTVSAMTIDRNGDVLLSRSNEIYRSSDRGKSWDIVFTGLTDEQFKTIAVTENEIPGTETVSAESLVTASASSQGLLVVGSSTGLTAVTAPVSARPTPKTPAKRISAICSLSVQKGCSVGEKGSARCQVTTTLLKRSDRKALAGRVMRLETLKRKQWRKVRDMTTRASGRASARIFIKKGETLRARIDTATVRCATRRVSIR